MVNVQEYVDGTTIAYVSPMVCNYNLANADHGEAITEPGWWVNAEDGPYKSEKEALETYGLTCGDEVIH